MLRLFGVTGLDRSGRPLAGAAVDRWLAGARDGLSGGIALPFAMALLEYDLEPQQLALDVSSGAVDLELEARAAARAGPPGGRRGRGDPPGRASPSNASTRTGRPGASSRTCSARRSGRGSARRSRSRISTARWTRSSSSPPPASTSCGSRCRSGASWPTGCTTPAWTCPSGTRATRRAGCRPGRRPRGGRPGPDRLAAGAGPASARRRRRRRRTPRLRPPRDGHPAPRRAGGRRRRGLRARRPRRGRPDGRDRRRRRRPGPLARGPRLRPATAPSRRHARVDRPGPAGRRAGPRQRHPGRHRPPAAAGRSPCNCSASPSRGPTAWARNGSWSARTRRWLADEPAGAARIVGEVVVRQALFPGHLMRFDEPTDVGSGAAAGWPFIVATALGRVRDEAIVMRARPPRSPTGRRRGPGRLPDRGRARGGRDAGRTGGHRGRPCRGHGHRGAGDPGPPGRHRLARGRRGAAAHGGARLVGALARWRRGRRADRDVRPAPGARLARRSRPDAEPPETAGITWTVSPSADGRLEVGRAGRRRRR